MLKKLKEQIRLIFKRIELSRINFLNHKLRKFIVKYEETNDTIKIYNSNGDSKIVKNTIPNKVKVMEIIKAHKKQMDKEITYYENNSEDYKIILISSSLFLIVLGCTFIFSFFVGSYILFFLTFFSFSITLSLFVVNTYKTLLFREEVKRLKQIKENKIDLEDNELLDTIKDSFKYVKKCFYDIVLKIINIFDNIKVKFN